MSETIPASSAVKVAAVKALARLHYNDSCGWQVWEECHTDEEIAELVADCATVKAAESLARRLANLWTERYDDVQAEVF